MKQIVATKKMFGFGTVAGLIPVMIGKLLDSHPTLHVMGKERPRHLSYHWPEHEIGISLLVKKGSYRTGLAHMTPLDSQPLEYAVKVVQVLMTLNEIARNTGGKEVPIESLAASPELLENARELANVEEEETEEGAG